MLLNLIVHLHNFRASKVGQNQLTSTFMPWLLEDANKYMMDGWREGGRDDEVLNT